MLAEDSDQQSTIAIVIDDLGNHRQIGEAAINLPGPVTLAFLPHTTHAHDQAERAYAQGKEIMLHLPMESHTGNELGPGGLTLHMTEQLFISTLQKNLASIPHVAGLNNHMGSLLTRHPGAMSWLMQGMHEHGNLFFIDSRTTKQTVAEQTAREHSIPTARRSVFLDNQPNPAAIRKQFQQLLHRARRHGYAIGIAHPHRETMLVLAAEIKKLEGTDIRLVAASQIIARQSDSNSQTETASQQSPKSNNSTTLSGLWHAPN